MNVLFATDGTESSQAACRLMSDLAWTGSDHLEVITVDPCSGDHGRVDNTSQPPPAGPRSGCFTDLLHQAQTTMQGRFGTISTRIHAGAPAREILAAAAEIEADLVVLGHRNRSRVSQWVLGSVSRAVVDHAACSVLVVHPRFEKLERVLLGYDGCQESDAALDWLLRPFLPAAACVWTISVSETVPHAVWGLEASFPLEYECQMAEEECMRRDLARRLADRSAAHLQQAGKTAEAVVARGDAAHEIVKAAHRFEVDLVVVGAHSQERRWRDLVGSTARAIASHGTFSTLVVRSRVARLRETEPETNAMHLLRDAPPAVP